MDSRQAVTVPATLEGVAAGARAFDGFVETHGLPESARWRFQVALDEILSNVVRHGVTPSRRVGRDVEEGIRLFFSLNEGVLTVEVADDGPAFDPLQAPVPDTSASLDDRQPGGLGIALVGALMDGVSYERRGTSNHLTMIWRVRTDEDPAPASGTGHTA